MTFHGAYPARPGLDWEPTPDPDPCRAFETALRVARAATHERKLDPPVAKAFAAIVDALDAVRDALRVQQRSAPAPVRGPEFGPIDP